LIGAPLARSFASEIGVVGQSNLTSSVCDERTTVMAEAILTISSKNYSSWSLRGWLLC
jgi:hypothetical protein